MKYKKTCLDPIQIVDVHWPQVGDPCRCIPITNEKGVNSRNWVVQLLSGDHYLLKLTTAKDYDCHLRAVEVQIYCHKHGAIVPKVLRPENSLSPVCLTGGYSASLQTYHTPDKQKTPQDYPALFARELGRLHALLRHYPGDIPERSGAYKELEPREFERIQELASSGIKTSFDLEVLAFLDRLVTLQGRAPVSSTYMQYVHMDFHPSNALLAEDGTPFILDFGHVLKENLRMSVAFSCHRFCQEQPSMAKGFLDAYFQADFHGEMEADSLQPYIVEEALNRIRYILRAHYFEGSNSWDGELEKQISYLEEAQRGFPY